LNGGKCTDKLLGFDCKCANGYAGATCEKSVKCLNKWTRYASTKVGGTTEQEPNHTEESCKEACMEMAGCYGVDYYYSNKTCWFQYTSKPSRNMDTKSVHLEWKNTCPENSCESTWKRYAQKKVGTRLNPETGHTVESCQQACMDTAGCTGVDYYKQQSGTCWFISTQNQAMLDDIACVHYELDIACPGENCKYTWSRYTQQSGVGLSKKESGHTEESCKDACLYTSDCTSVDYYKDLEICFFGFTSSPSRQNTESSVHLDMTKKCPGQICEYMWIRLANISLKGLTRKETDQTEESCKQACIDTSGCLFVDYYPQSKICWFGYEMSNNSYTDTTSILLFVLKSCSKSKCVKHWHRNTETQGSGMTIRETGHTEDSCKQACDDTQECTGVNYYKKPSGTCWFGFTTDPAQTTDEASVYLKLNKVCPSLSRGLASTLNSMIKLVAQIVGKLKRP